MYARRQLQALVRQMPPVDPELSSLVGVPRREARPNQFTNLLEVRPILLKVRMHQAHQQASEKRLVGGDARPALKELAQEDLRGNLARKHDARMRREGLETWANDLHYFNEVGVHDPTCA